MSSMSTQQAPARRRGGYQRSANGLLGAMVATVLVVVAFVVFRGLTRDNAATTVPSVDYQISLKAARADGKLQALAPRATLPSGWKATSVSYLPGVDPAWHLGLLTEKQKYVGIYESRDDLDSLVQDHVNGDSSAGKDVTVAGSTWRVYTGSGGDYALGRTVQHAGGSDAQLVVGSAPDAAIRDFTASLTGG
jgi:hypothetical protein